jgi:hypothetical protein
MKNKKGVSPLIAWVLIIGLSVSMGFLVINWAKDVIPEPEPDLSFCDDVNLMLISYTSDHNEFVFNIMNNGLFTIKKWSFGVTKTHAGPTNQWCDKLDTFSETVSLIPGDSTELIFMMGEFPTRLCEDRIDWEGGVVNPEEVVLVPWIIPIEGEDSINCNDRKITIFLEE